MTNLANIYRGEIKAALQSTEFLVTDERVIPDLASPTGKVFIGVAKTPLKKVAQGFGYSGILLQTDNREFIQCHVCGTWYRRIVQTHLANHNLTAGEYKERFSLFPTTPLASDATRERMEQNGRQNLLAYMQKNTMHLREQSKKATALSVANRINRSKIDEHNNKYAMCEVQLGFRLFSYLKKHHKLPAATHSGEGQSIARGLRRRYGSTNAGFRHYGLPQYYRIGTTVELLAPNGNTIKFNYNANYDKKFIYGWIDEECNVNKGIKKYANETA